MSWSARVGGLSLRPDVLAIRDAVLRRLTFAIAMIFMGKPGLARGLRIDVRAWLISKQSILRMPAARKTGCFYPRGSVLSQPIAPCLRRLLFFT